MARVKLELGALKDANWWEWVLRFAFGGIVTVITGIIAMKYGPGFGGLFLAFPAILPASATLLEQHDGQKAAGVDAFGAVMGTIGLMAFGAVVWLLSGRLSPWLVLPLALVAWFVVSAGLWLARRALRHPGPGRSPSPVRTRAQTPS